ncbi:MAG: benzoate--CoA ligase, partial [Pseudomonadota bacterium]|nr:benzoate--CoA ligase [Pseudomonadota bacterium]
QFPGVAEVAATEIRVKSDATVIAAFYVTSQDVDETAFSEFAQTCLARYKQPRLYVKMDALPKGGNGKLNRKALRQHWEADHDQA